jgi:hypothetical protein
MAAFPALALRRAEKEVHFAAGDCLLRYKARGRVIAIALIYRDFDSLRA